MSAPPRLLTSSSSPAVAVSSATSTSSASPIAMSLELMQQHHEQQRRAQEERHPELEQQSEQASSPLQMSPSPSPHAAAAAAATSPAPARSATPLSQFANSPRREGAESPFWMCVYRPQRTSRIGVAYFDVDVETLYGAEYSSMEQVLALKHRLRPSTIVTSAQPSDELFQTLAQNELDPSKPFVVRALKRDDFAVDSAAQRLRLLQVEELAGSQKESDVKKLSKLEHSLLLRSAIDFSKSFMVSALGALVLHLLSTSVVNQLELDRATEPISIRSVQPIPSISILEMDGATLSALGVFVQDAHPGMGRRGSGSKEGFSVFSLMDSTQTYGGARMLRQWFTFPTTDIDVIRRRHEHIRYFVEPAHTDLVGALRSHLRKIKDMARLLTRFQDKPAKRFEWRTFVEGLRRMVSIAHLLHDLHTDLPLFETLHSLYVPEMQELLESVSRVIELEDTKQRESKEEERDETIHVHTGINDKLDSLRWNNKHINSLIRPYAEEDVRSLLSAGSLSEEIAEEYELVYLPQIGFLVRLPHQPSETDPQEMERRAPGFEFKFRTDTHVFFKNNTALHLDGEYGDLQGAVTDAENAIVRQVQERIMDLAETITDMSACLAELDCFLSLAAAALTHNLVCPRMSSDPVLSIRDGRHLLREKRLDSFVANSTELAAKKKRRGEGANDMEEEKEQEKTSGLIHVISGPNNSGKTVYLKQVGLIVYLAHTGCFVPAAEATIGVCDRILARLNSVETIMSTLSTFTYDCSQMSYMLRHCTSRSLCLVDEFGKGTLHLNGIALLAAVVHHLERRGADCPKALIATHFHELFALQLLKESELVSFWKMDFVGQDPTFSSSDSLRSRSANGGGGGDSTSPRRFSAVSFGSSPGASAQQQRRHAHQQAQEVKSNDGDEEKHAEHLPKITYLYKLVPGISQSSFGVQCAAQAGVDERVLLRAAEVAEEIAAGKLVSAVGISAPPAPAAAAPTGLSRDDKHLWLEFLDQLLPRARQLRASGGEQAVTRALVELDEEYVESQLKRFLEQRARQVQLEDAEERASSAAAQANGSSNGHGRPVVPSVSSNNGHGRQARR